MSVDLQQQIDELRTELAKYTKEHAEFRSVHVSRRGHPGGQGERGATGATGSPGSQGVPGRNARVVIGTVVAGVEASASITEQADGVHVLNLVLPRGLQGERGADSTVAGPAGKDGESIKGERGESGKDAAPAKDGVNGTNGRDAVVRIGNVVAGEVAGVSVRETSDGQVLDFVLPRGERGQTGVGASGKDGATGPAGKDSEGFTQSEIARMEARFRNIWKNDIQAALRGHFNESHFNKN